MTHKRISFIKSLLRILGYISVYIGYMQSVPWFVGGLVLLVLAEVLGILEEINE